MQTVGKVGGILVTMCLSYSFNGSVQTICISQNVVLYESNERWEVAMNEMDWKRGGGTCGRRGPGMLHYY